MNNKHHNVQSVRHSNAFTVKKDCQESNLHLQPNGFGNKEETREELQFIKGKKCIKCGYSSVKVEKN